MHNFYKAMQKLFLVGIVLYSHITLAYDYPTKPIDFIVGFGAGGSADRMARAMSTFISEELGQPVNVINKKGDRTQIAANYVLSSPNDGYTVFASTFAPYLSDTILKGNASYTLQDFAYINFQWFDYDFIAVNKDAKYQDLVELISAMRDNQKSLKVAAVDGSSGHLMVKQLFDKLGISKENIVTFKSGGKARLAVAKGKVDFIVASSRGSEFIRDFVRPVAVMRSNKSERWDAPTINEALKPLGIDISVLPGSMRGFAVANEFKEMYPERHDKLVQAFKSVLDREDVKSFLEDNDIGGLWLGPDRSKSLLELNYNTFSAEWR